VHKRPRQQQAAALAARELRGAHVALTLEGEHPDHLFGALLGLVAAHAEVAAVVNQRLPDRQEAVEVDVLLGQADPAARL